LRVYLAVILPPAVIVAAYTQLGLASTRQRGDPAMLRQVGIHGFPLSIKEAWMVRRRAP
jgi:hypothetical protein